MSQVEKVRNATFKANKDKNIVNDLLILVQKFVNPKVCSI